MAITGEYIKARRESLGWTQKELADKMNVTTRTIINWEQGGKIPEHSTALLEKILENKTESVSPGLTLYVPKADLLKYGRIIIEVV